MIRKIIRKARGIVLESLLSAKNFKYENSIIIFSEARGGSTWLMEMIASLPNSCINWEPFHDDSGVVPKNYKLGWIPYLSPDEQDPRYYKLISDILSFKVSTPYTRKYLSVKTVIKADTVITKFVRANLLLPYILRNFRLNYPPIFLLRHPIDTCMSQIKAFQKNDKSFITDEIPIQLNNDRYVNNIDYIRGLETKLEKKIANWCLNNVPTINQLNSFENLIVVYYSDLLLDPEKEMERILNHMQIVAHPEKLLQRIEFRQVSSTDFKKQFRTDPQEQLLKNFELLDAVTKERIQSIFDRFGFRLYDAYSPYPHKENWKGN